MKAIVAKFSRLVALSFVMMLLANASFAQKGKRANLTPEQRAARVAKHLTNKLGLTAEQTTQVQAANLPLQKARQNAQTTGDRSAMKAARETYRAELNKILTAEQQAKLKAMQDERKANKGKGHGHGHGKGKGHNKHD